MAENYGTGVDIFIGEEGDQDAIWSSTNHSIQEESTPIDPADTTGAYGQISATIRTHDGIRSYRDKRMDLTDGAQGKTTGIIRGLSGNRMATTLTADSRLAQVAVERTAQPYVGPLGDALRYYLSLCGVVEDIVVDDTLNLLPVKLLGWKANVYDQLKRLGPAYGFEVTLVSSKIVFRPFRGRVAENYRDAQVDWTIDATRLAQKVEGYAYNLESGTLLAYPYGGWNEDVTVYTVDAGQTTTIEIPIDGSVSFVEQPTCVAFVDRSHSSSSVYSVSGNDGIAIQPAQWAAGGGDLKVEIGEDTRTLVVTIKASSETEYAPYRIGVSSGPSDYYSSLRIRGEGVFFTKELMTLPAAVNPDRAPQEIGATVDNEFYEDPNQLFHGLLWSATRYAMARATINVTSKGINRRGDSGSLVFPTIGELKAQDLGDTIGEIYTELGPTIADWNSRLIELVGTDFENQAYGNVGGARVIHDDCWYRIRSATITPASIRYSAEWDNTIGDVYHHGETIGEWNARWAGKTIRDVNEAPLQGIDDYAPLITHGYGHTPYGHGPYGHAPHGINP